MKELLFYIGKDLNLHTEYENQARASEAIWKAAYVLGFEIETEEENTLHFRKKGFFGKERLLVFSFEQEKVFLEAEIGDFKKLKNRLG